MKTMREVGDDRIIDLIWVGSEETELMDKFLNGGVEIKKDWTGSRWTDQHSTNCIKK